MFPVTKQNIIFHLLGAALLTVIIHYILARKTINNLKLTAGNYDDAKGLTAPFKVEALNFDQMLSKDTPAENRGEIAALQILCNLLDGQKVVNVTGVWDAKTEEFIKMATDGQISTNLKGFINITFPYHAPEYTPDQLIELINTQLLK